MARAISGNISHPPRPPRSANSMDGEEYRLGLKWSLIGHGAVLLFIIMKSLIFPSHSTPYIPTLRVDVVGLPDILKKDLSKVQKLPATSKDIADVLKKSDEEARKEAQKARRSKPKEIAKPDEMVIHPRKSGSERRKKLLQSLERIQALSKIAAEEESESHPVVIKGNKISKGSSLSGDARESSEASYYDILRDRLQENWELDVWLARQNLDAKVRLSIDSNGKLRGFQFVKPSGNPQFDDAVKRAILKSQPFPKPPSNIDTLVDGVLVGFPL